jgi:hypothetical protein
MPGRGGPRRFSVQLKGPLLATAAPDTDSFARIAYFLLFGPKRLMNSGNPSALSMETRHFIENCILYSYAYVNRAISIGLLTLVQGRAYARAHDYLHFKRGS